MELLVDSVRMRALADDKTDITATDVLKEMFTLTPPEQSMGRGMPAGMLRMLTSMTDLDLPEGEQELRTFKTLGIKPETLFPDIKKKREAMQREELENGAGKAGDFIGLLIARVQEKNPELAARALKMLGGDDDKTHAGRVR